MPFAYTLSNKTDTHRYKASHEADWLKLIELLSCRYPVKFLYFARSRLF